MQTYIIEYRDGTKSEPFQEESYKDAFHTFMMDGDHAYVLKRVYPEDLKEKKDDG